MALPEDVVLYDLDAEADADALIEMLNDPEVRWFARARLASMAQRGLVAATFNPNLHPRGHDGKFIEVFGWVRWLWDGRWERGQVRSIDPDTGQVNVRVPGDATDTTFTKNFAQKVLYSIPAPKGSLDLPDPQKGEKESLGFEKVGGQGGSNPGALFKVQEGSPFLGTNKLSPDTAQAIAGANSLDVTYGTDTDTYPIIFSDSNGNLALAPEAGASLIRPDNEKFAAAFDMGTLKSYTGSPSAVMDAWAQMSAESNLLSTDDQIYIKHAKSQSHAANEILANRLYEMAGVRVADVIPGSDGVTIGSKIVTPPGAPKVEIGQALNDPEVMARMRADFAVDAWLANWDVAGLGLENTQVVDGYPVRIDAGGALLYRAQGGPKGAMFGPVVGEIDTLRDPSMNPAAAKVFKDVTDAEIQEGVGRIAAISPAEISDLVGSSDLDISIADHVSDTLIARRAYLLDKYGVVDPFEDGDAAPDEIDDLALPEVPEVDEPGKFEDLLPPLEDDKPIFPEPDFEVGPIEEVEPPTPVTAEEALADGDDGQVFGDVEGYNSALQVGDSALDWSQDTSPEKEAAAAALVGKMVVVTPNGMAPEDGGLYFPGYKSAGGASMPFVAYAEEVVDSPSPKLVLRHPTGIVANLSLGMTTPVTLREVGNLEPDVLKSASAPTMKADGTIAYNGFTVGTWQKENIWSKQVAVSLDGEHNITGLPMTFTAWGKTDAKSLVHGALVPKAPQTKSKKGSPAVAKIAEVAHAAETPSLGGQTYSDGTTEAKHGDWVSSIKGGGGFVGKIVGWPNQEQHPGLVFVADTHGVQKAVKLASSKKVDPPIKDLLDDDLSLLSTPEGVVPNAYEGLLLSDGKVPTVGMEVKAGKPGTAQAEGFITNINPKQGTVYIQTTDGKNIEKKMSVVTFVADSPIYWEQPNQAVTAAVLETPVKPKKKGTKTPKISYPGPDNAVYEQPQAAIDAWLEGNPKRKTTKDGYAPEVGMAVRTKDGDRAVVISVAGEWDQNPNKVVVWNIDAKKAQTTAAGSIELDHERMLTDYAGDPLKKVGAIYLPSNETASGFKNPTQLFPDGSTVYRYAVTNSYYDQTSGNIRYYENWQYMVVSPTGSFWSINNNYISSPNSALGIKGTFKWNEPSKMEKVATIDSSATGNVVLQSQVSSPKFPEAYKPSSIEFVDVAPSEATPEPEPVSTPDLPSTPAVSIPAVEPGEAGPGLPPAATLVQSQIKTFPPPPDPDPVTTAKTDDPPLPQIAGSTTLGEKHSVFSNTPSRTIAEAAADMLAKKDSKDPGSSRSYAMGDSDLIEDMTTRFNVEVTPDGTESLVLRFRLRESVSEGLAAKLATTGEGKKGAWKLQGTKFANELQPNDLIAVYISSNTGNPLKPAKSDKVDEPNARIVEPPKFVGKSLVNQEYDLYRVKVMTLDGDIAEVDVEQRPEGSIPTYEYDHQAPAKGAGSTLQTTATAQQEGWVHLGKMQMDGSQGSVNVDSTGKKVLDKGYGGGTSVLANGSGGRRYERKMGDGTKINFQSAHEADGGTGDSTTRRANISGEVLISVPIDGRPEEDIIRSMSEALQLVDVPTDKQGAPSNQQLTTWALSKVVTNYHPKYDYRSEPVTSLNDPRVNETFVHMDKKLQAHLGRSVTADDIRFHTTPEGRVTVVWSPEVAKAIAKAQGGTHHYHHSGVDDPYTVLGSPNNGLLSIDERWSMGVMTTGQSSVTDMQTGAGDRVFMRTVQGDQFSSGHVILNPLMVNSNVDLYTASGSDTWGKRPNVNATMNAHPGGYEFNLKRMLEAEKITLYIAHNEASRDNIIQGLHDRGIFSIGGRPIDQIVVTSAQAKALPNFEDIGIEQFKNDIPITTITGAAA